MEEVKISKLVLHDASAGSGKTFTLVKNYLEICLNPAQPIDIYIKILAITFTNKAAKEMKDRIVDQLEDFVTANPKNDFLLDYYSNVFKVSKPSLKKRAFRVLQHILHNFSQFSVSTIDKFMLKIIRSIQYEIGLTDSFELIMDYEEWFKESIAEVVDDVERDKKVEDFLYEYLKTQIHNDKTWNLEFEILKIANSIVQEDYVKHMKGVLEVESFQEILSFQDELNTKKASILNILELIHKSYREIVEKYNLALTDFSRKSCPIYKVFAYTDLQVVFKKLEKVKLESLVKKMDSCAFFAKAKLKEAHFEQAQLELEQFVENNREAIYQVYFHSILYKKIENQVKGVQFEYLLNNKLQAYLERNHLLPIGALNGILEEYIQKEEIPMLMMKMGERYEYIFIDEFQDTSDTQWSNLYPFIENILSKGFQVHLIGDAKQSIYRFRGGDVNLLLNLKSDRDRGFYEVIDAPALKSNWRSGKDIVQFNNTLFSDLILKEITKDTYRNIYTEAAQNIEIDNEAYVEVRSTAVNADLVEEVNFNQIRLTIEDALLRGFKYGDICVLCRGAKEINLIASYLLEQNIPFVNDDSLLVFSDKQVQFLHQLLEYYIDPKNSILHSKILAFVYREVFDKHDDFSLFYNKWAKKGFDQIFKAHNIQFPKQIESNYFEYLEQVTHALGFNKNIYTLQFLEIAHQQISKGNTQVHDFLKRCIKGKEKWKVVLSESQETVKILTVHKSKGLEYPIVILPFLTQWTIYSRYDSQWYHIEPIFDKVPYINTDFKEEVITYLPDSMVGFIKQIKADFDQNMVFDFINLVYVACTRASQELYILNVFPEAKKTKDYQVDKSTLTDFVMDYFVPIELWNAEALVSYGVKKNKTEIKRYQNSKSEALKKIVLNKGQKSHQWNEKIKIAQHEDYNWIFEEQISAQQQGNHIHNILALIRTDLDVERALNIYFSKRWIPKDDMQKWRKVVFAIVTHPELKQYFSNDLLGIWNERDWLGINGEVLRPDRVVKLKNGKLVIIDYKTGKPDKGHHAQIEEYARQLAFSTFDVEKSILFYTEDFSLKIF